MNWPTAAILSVVALIVIGVIYWIYRDRRAGKRSCGCSTSCTACSGCGPEANVIIELGDDTESEKDTKE